MPEITVIYEGKRCDDNKFVGDMYDFLRKEGFKKKKLVSIKTEYHILTKLGKIKYTFSQNFNLPSEERLERIFRKIIDNSEIRIKCIEGLDNEDIKYQMENK